MSAPAPAGRLATWSDLVALPEDARAEVLDGEISMQPSPSVRHQRVVAGLTYSVAGPLEFDPTGPGGWWFVPDVDIELTKHRIVRPDLSGWRRERMPALPEEAPVHVVPDWVCEVLSPSNHRRDRMVKARFYLEAGIPHLWLIDPAERIIEALAAEGPRWVRLGMWGDGDLARIAPFEAVELSVGALFS